MIVSNLRNLLCEHIKVLAERGFPTGPDAEVTARGLLGHVTEEMTYLYADVDLAEKREAVARAFMDLPDPDILRRQEVGTSGGDHPQGGDGC
jgi:hypothetical protein